MRLSRRKFQFALVTFVAAALILILFALDHVISHRRWSVKTLSDADRSRVVREPVDATVAVLSSLPRAPEPLPLDGRVPPHEVTVYQVRAKLVAVHKMLDGDFHMEIADPDTPSARMIVEIPAPGEGKASGLEATFRAARQEVLRRGAKDRLIRVTGVGFFDYTHWQPGAARNGFELHPVLAVEFLE